MQLALADRGATNGAISGATNGVTSGAVPSSSIHTCALYGCSHVEFADRIYLLTD